MKKLLALGATAAICLSAVACGTASVSVASSTESEVPGIRVVTTFAGNDGNAQNYRAAVKEWEAKTGNKVNDASAISDEAFKAQVVSDFENGEEPDVLFYFNGVDANSIVEAGKVVSIADIRKEYPDYGRNMKDSWLGASLVDGRNYSLPVNGYWEGMYVNKKVLADCEVALPGSDYTWEQFMTDCRVIKSKGYSPVAVSLGQIPHYWFEFTIYNQLSPSTHNILPNGMESEQGRAWVAGVKDIKMMYQRGYFPPDTLTASDDDTFKLFMEDKAAFLVDGSWKTGTIMAQLGEDEKTGAKADPERLANFTVTYVPGKNNRKTTDIISGLSSGYYITKKAWDDPVKRAAAVDFVMFMTSDAMVSKFAGASVTALVEGVTIDESELNSLQKDGLAMVKGATDTAGAVQDQIPPSCRVPLFEGMPQIVTGEVQPEDAVAECLRLLTENAQ